MARELTKGLDLLELGCHGNVELVTLDETFSSSLPLKTVSFFRPMDASSLVSVVAGTIINVIGAGFPNEL